MYDKKTKRITAAELLVTVLILGILGAITAPRFSHSAAITKQSQCDSNVELLQSAVELYSTEKGVFPKTLEEVTNNKEFFPVAAPKCPFGGEYILKDDHTVTCTHIR